MNYFFDKKFKLGMLTGVVLFVIINFASYKTAQNRYYEVDLFSPFNRGGFNWGFPVAWGRQDLISLDDGVINIVFALLLGVIVGTIFKFARR